MTESGSYHHGTLRPALIEAGLAILEESGLAGLSLRACAERVGVSHAAPKNHFGNLQGLLTAIAAVGYQRLAAAMQSDSAETTGPADAAERRRAALVGYVDFATLQPALFELMFSRQRTSSSDPVLLDSAARCFAVLRDASAGLVWDKSGAPDAELRAQVMHWSLVHGFAQLTIAGRLAKGDLATLDILDVFPQFAYRDDA